MTTTYDLNDEVKDLAAKVQYLVDFCNQKGVLEDGTFTFPDGDTWEATK